MNNTGYGDIGMKGSVATGFQTYSISKDFASDLDKKAPLPNGCTF